MTLPELYGALVVLIHHIAVGDVNYFSSNECANKCSDILDTVKAYRNVEDEFGVDLLEFFNDKEDPFAGFEIEIGENENGENEIYFDGDSFYGHYTKEAWFKLIRRMIKAYKETWCSKGEIADL